MLPIKALKIHIANHSEIPYQTLKKKKKIVIINFIKKHTCNKFNVLQRIRKLNTKKKIC